MKTEQRVITMLVIISDLHFTDGTTSNKAGQKDLFNISPEAFRLFYAKIANIVERRQELIKKVTFVYNGDIFDPLRTYVWFNVPQNQRPWSVPLVSSDVRKTCNQILKSIITHNDEALAWLNGTHPDFENIWQVGQTIRRIYIPGNHDRIINLYEPCRRQVHQNLLNSSASQVFENKFADAKHQTLVMHGHEADAFNCEFDLSGNPQYKAVPIGDPMTTMLFALLGYRANFLPIPKEAKHRFRELDNVRPSLAAIRFIQNIISDFNISNPVASMIRRVVAEFEDLDFYRHWLQSHDRLNIGFDEADKLQLALGAIKLLGASVPSGLLEKLAALVRDDACQQLAQKMLAREAGGNLRYCVMGHTHEPVHTPLYVDQKRNIQKHYLNTGTFRTTFSQTFDRQNFLRFQRMSFAIIYGPNEFQPHEETPVYELWSGLRMHS